KMKNTANELINGNYNEKNNISQNDEIGDLANTMDLLTIRLDAASKQSDTLDKMRKDFVANISHELKTPITVIRGSLEALVDKIVTDPIKVDNYHNQMLNETLFLQRLVGDLLDLSKLQNTDFIIDKQEISILDVVVDALRSASHISLSKGISINLYKPNNPIIINGDYGRLRQMFMIILHNAIKFSPEKSTVDVIFENNTISICDFGVGISNDDLPYIFDRFYKSRSEENKSGTGLGLAIAKQIAHRHEIELYAINNETNGSTFIFKL
ncbi:MAG: HAMP domain-containing sensor histidine kinase, partial [Clostridium sp.]